MTTPAGKDLASLRADDSAANRVVRTGRRWIWPGAPLALSLALLLSLVVPGLYHAQHRWQALGDDAQRDLGWDLDQLADTLAVALREPLADVDGARGKGTVQAMFRDPRLVSVSAYRTGEKNPAVDLFRSVDAATPTLTRQRRLFDAEREIGRFEVVISTGPMLQKLERERRSVLFDALWIVVLVPAVMLIVLWRTLVVPARVIGEALARLAERGSQAAAEPLDLHCPGEPLAGMAKNLRALRLKLSDSTAEIERRELELRGYANTLEARAEQRGAELAAAKEQWAYCVEQLDGLRKELLESEKLASLGRLVAGIAHELNTPLGNSLTVVTALDERLKDVSQLVTGGPIRRSELDAFLTQSRDGMDMLLRNIERATMLIKSFKQVAIDQSSERRREFDLAQVIEETLVTLQPRFKRTPYEIRTELADNILLDGYPGPLGQVVTNLVLNALLHGLVGRPYGSVVIRTDRLGASHVRLVCRDDGNGMTPEVQARIFEPFFTTKLRQGGSGLGMNIVKSIVTDVLGGRVEVQSRPGEGTAVIVDIPVSAPPAGEAGEAA
jgi:two-component system, NtrC family, sensor kinase